MSSWCEGIMLMEEFHFIWPSPRKNFLYHHLVASIGKFFRSVSLTCNYQLLVNYLLILGCFAAGLQGCRGPIPTDFVPHMEYTHSNNHAAILIQVSKGLIIGCQILCKCVYRHMTNKDDSLLYLRKIMLWCWVSEE